jgi:hypothetical protein
LLTRSHGQGCLGCWCPCILYGKTQDRYKGDHESSGCNGSVGDSSTIVSLLWQLAQPGGGELSLNDAAPTAVKKRLSSPGTPVKLDLSNERHSQAGINAMRLKAAFPSCYRCCTRVILTLYPIVLCLLRSNVRRRSLHSTVHQQRLDSRKIRH